LGTLSYPSTDTSFLVGVRIRLTDEAGRDNPYYRAVLPRAVPCEFLMASAYEGDGINLCSSNMAYVMSHWPCASEHSAERIPPSARISNTRLIVPDSRFGAERRG
jgi:hypothetical protein